jgi:uncharacterized protein YbcI
VQGSSAGGQPAPLRGGQLLAAISHGIVGMVHEHYGRGPINAKTYALDDMIVVVLRGSGFTALEQTIMDSGDPQRVIASASTSSASWLTGFSRQSRTLRAARSSRS